MRILFCDVDGVLNRGRGEPDEWRVKAVADTCVRLNAALVFHSGWRDAPELRYHLELLFAGPGMPRVGFTEANVNKAVSVMDFLDGCHEGIDGYCVLDDDPVVCRQFPGCSVLTSGGVSDADLRKVEDVIGGGE